MRTRKKSLMDLEALPPNLRDFTRSCHPRRGDRWGGPSRPEPGLAPESALRLHPCRALSSAPVSPSVETQRYVAKMVIDASSAK